MEPSSTFVNPLLTDMYQVTMTYAYWKGGRHEDPAVFDLFFRKNPFKGEFCILAGTDEVLKLLASYKFTDSDIMYLAKAMPNREPEFFAWLRTLNCSKVKLYTLGEGTVVFPREPLMRIEGPLAITQLLETTLLNLINFPSLVATCAARMRLEAGPDKMLLEFGLRRAQGPDGGMCASKYSFVGGFNGTSNVLAGKLFDLAISGTHAHSYVMAHTGLNDLSVTTIKKASGETTEFVAEVMKIRERLSHTSTNIGELAAFIAYAQAFPEKFLALVDTFDTLRSGIPNFICVGAILFEFGYAPMGFRLDSGDLAALSKAGREMLRSADIKLGKQVFAKCKIVASNDINETSLRALNLAGHEIDTYGIGTHLATCYECPALGCVYKLVEIKGVARIKVSEEIEKIILPGKKSVYRLYNAAGQYLLDLVQLSDDPAPKSHTPVICRNPFKENERLEVTAARVESMLQLVWDEGHPTAQPQLLDEVRTYCQSQISSLSQDHKKFPKPEPYKVFVNERLYEFLHKLWLKEAPVETLR